MWITLIHKVYSNSQRNTGHRTFFGPLKAPPKKKKLLFFNFFFYSYFQVEALLDFELQEENKLFQVSGKESERIYWRLKHHWHGAAVMLYVSIFKTNKK